MRQMELIDRQTAINTADTMLSRCDTGCLQDYHDIMVDALNVLPTIDAEPVRRGKWWEPFKDGDMYCSECHAVVEMRERFRRNWYYCPHCGAKMEENR